jgi:AraC-like DNA-binding protein
MEVLALLTGADQSVSEIAYGLGFKNAPYFLRLFKKEMGMSPNEFKKDEFQFELRIDLHFRILHCIISKICE